MRGQSPILWIGVGIFVVLSAQACDKLGLTGNQNPTAPSGPPSAGTTIVYTAVGASDALGVGASALCFPFADCPDGTGYVPVAVRQLKGRGFPVTLRNLGIPTAVIGPDFQSLGRQYGRTIEANFIEQEMPFLLTNSTVVSIFAGGNEVNTITAALGGGAGGSNPTAYIDGQVRAFGTDFDTLLKGVRDRAGAARIVVLNLPNLAGLPFLAGASLQQKQAAQRAAVGMTTSVINPLTSQNVLVVDLMCDSRLYQPSNYSSDGFHPNDSGYAVLAGEIVAAVTATPYPSPRASCQQMTLVQ